MPRPLIQLSNYKFLTVALALIALSLLLSVFIQFSIAQQKTAARVLEVSPPSQELAADPGQTITAKAKVSNRSDSPVNIKVRVEDFTAQGEQGQVELIDRGDDSLTKWAKLDNDSFSLRPGESKEVNATITVPKSAAGGHYGSFVFENVASATPGSAAISQEVASLFLIKLSGPVNENMTITDFSAPSFVEFGPVAFNIKLKNSGNVHISPHGLVNVTDVFGNTTEDVVFQPVNVFPGAERVLSANLDKTFLIGPYKATALLNYGSKNTALTATVTFFAFPVRIVVAILIILFILFLGRKRLGKSFKALAGK